MKLEKGDYVLKLHVRHEKKEHLDKLTDMVMTVSSRLTVAISVDTYSTWGDAITQGKKFTSITLPPGIAYPLYVSPLLAEK